MKEDQKQAERGQGTVPSVDAEGIIYDDRVVGRRWYLYRVGGLYCTLDADTRQDAEEYIISESQGCDIVYVSEYATQGDAEATLLRLSVVGDSNA